MAEFVLNSRVHSGNDHSPFEVLYGFRPDFTIPARKHSNIPALDSRLDRMAEICKEAEAALRLAKKCQKDAYEARKLTAHSFKPGDKVMLSAKDISIRQKSAKLGPC